MPYFFSFAFLQALLFVFSILRKVAWDYGRLALVTDADRQVQPLLLIRWWRNIVLCEMVAGDEVRT